MSKLDRRRAAFRNEILSRLPDNEIELLYPHLNHVTLVPSQALYEPDSPVTDLFFVDEGIVSLTANTHDSGHVEVGLTGREGFVGASVILNPEPHSVHRAFTQVAGSAYRVSAAAMRSAI